MENEKINEDIEFFLEDVSRPVAIVRLNGIIDEANEKFSTVFGIGKRKDIREVIGRQSLNVWKSSLEDIKHKSRLTFNLKVTARIPEFQSVTVSLIFCKVEEKAIVLFNLPFNFKRSPRNDSSIAFRKSDSLMIVADLDGYIEDVNDLTKEFFDLSPDDFIGGKCEEFFYLLFGKSANYDKYKQKVIDEGQAEIIHSHTKLSKDVRYYKITSFFDKDCELFLIKITDCTESTLLKQDLAHKGSLSEVGQLAASIAHEIRNPMTTLKGFTQLLKESATEENLKYLTVIDDEILRMESILSEMLFLSKPSVMEKKLICPKKLLGDIIDIIYPKATSEGIEIVQKEKITFASSIYGEEGKLKQVLLNLLKNALESMEPGGILTIIMENDENEQVKLIVEDTGKGMNDAQLSQIFSPYFTTRSNGTGLGLPFVLKTVENHGGTITVSSKIGHGSRFVLSFPVGEEIAVTEDVLKESVLAK